VTVLAAALLALPVNAADGDAGQLSGRVLGASDPLPRVAVYAYRTAERQMERVLTDLDGEFSFAQLPAGIYKIVAFKPGFLPAVVMLNRASSDLQQSIQLRLSEEALSESNDAAEDFWSVREAIPGDVLRDLARAGIDDVMAMAPIEARQARFETQMLAATGMRQVAAEADAHVTQAQVDVAGNFRKYRVGLQGDFQHLGPVDSSSELDGRAHTVSLNLHGEGVNRVNLTMLDNLLRDAGDTVELKTHQLEWSQKIGDEGQSDFSARVVEESNFLQRGAILPVATPISSRSWQMAGSYETALGGRSSIETSVRYMNRESDYHSAYRYGDLAPVVERMEMYGGGGYEVSPTVVVEYGVFSTLHNGSLSLAPRGEMVFQLSPAWRASGAVSYRVHQQERPDLATKDFLIHSYESSDPCRNLVEECYQFVVSRLWGESQSMSLGAVHRTYGETMRVYFNEDFFANPQSLYIVPGDELPELQFEIQRRIAPGVHTRLESSIASGGGGRVLATQQAFENEIDYFVTSLDTRFDRTSTGVFLAFHRLEQTFNPLGRWRKYTPRAEYERLQLLLTQDLGILRSLADNLAVQLDMEVSRGGELHEAESDELLKRFAGAVAMKF
jgi:hypothetical protein